MRLGSMQLGLPVGRAGGDPLARALLAIFRRPGVEAHAYIPGIGTIGGLALQNFIMEDGTQPLSVDQPWGYAGDPVSTVGSELVTNGDFSNALTNWSLITPPSPTVVGGILVVERTAGFVGAEQGISVVSGRSYVFSGQAARTSGTGVPVLRVRTGAGLAGVVLAENIVSSPNASLTTYSFVFTATSTGTIYVQAVVNTAAAVCQFDNISVKELVGAIPARQATTANKPILRRGAVNRALWSQDFSNAQWVKTNLSIGTGETAPDGTTTAQKLIATAVSATHRVNYNSSASSSGLGTKTNSIYLKAAEYITATVNCSDNVSGDFAASINLTTGVVGTVATSGVWTSTSITSENAGNGWWRVRLTGTNATNPLAFISVFPNNTTSYLGNGVSGILAWGAQLETGSTASPYIPTTTAAASASTGPYWAEYDGTDFMSLAAVPFQVQDDHCVVTALSPATTLGAAFALGRSSSTAPYVARIRVPSASNITVDWRDDAGVNIAHTTASQIGTSCVVSARNVGGTKIARRNGVQFGASSTSQGSTTLDNATIGGYVSPSPSYFTGQIYPVIMVKGTITDAELSTIERWVAQQSGVTL